MRILQGKNSSFLPMVLHVNEGRNEMDNLLLMVSAWLTVFGISFAFALTHGPFGLFERVRDKLETKAVPDWVKIGVKCPICISFWVGACVALWLNGGLLMWLSSVGFVCVITSLSPE
jgi:succinate dehydrogenase hydrophobic anchor subunit